MLCRSPHVGRRIVAAAHAGSQPYPNPRASPHVRTRASPAPRNKPSPLRPAPRPHNLPPPSTARLGRSIRYEAPRNAYEALGNLATSLEFLKAKGVRLVNVGAEDLHDGALKQVLGLTWILILHYDLSVGDGPADPSARFAELREWTAHVTEGVPGIDLSLDLAPVASDDAGSAGAPAAQRARGSVMRPAFWETAFRDGTVLAAVIDSHSCTKEPLFPLAVSLGAAPPPPAEQLIDAAFAAGLRRGAPRLLDPSDVAAGLVDTHSMITYVSKLRTAMGDAGDAVLIQAAYRRHAARRGRKPPKAAALGPPPLSSAPSLDMLLGGFGGEAEGPVAADGADGTARWQQHAPAVEMEEESAAEGPPAFVLQLPESSEAGEGEGEGEGEGLGPVEEDGEEEEVIVRTSRAGGIAELSRATTEELVEMVSGREEDDEDGEDGEGEDAADGVGETRGTAVDVTTDPDATVLGGASVGDSICSEPDWLSSAVDDVGGMGAIVHEEACEEDEHDYDVIGDGDEGLPAWLVAASAALPPAVQHAVRRTVRLSMRVTDTVVETVGPAARRVSATARSSVRRASMAVGRRSAATDVPPLGAISESTSGSVAGGAVGGHVALHDTELLLAYLVLLGGVLLLGLGACTRSYGVPTPPEPTLEADAAAELPDALRRRVALAVGRAPPLAIGMLAGGVLGGTAATAAGVGRAVAALWGPVLLRQAASSAVQAAASPPAVGRLAGPLFALIARGGSKAAAKPAASLLPSLPALGSGDRRLLATALGRLRLALGRLLAADVRLTADDVPRLVVKLFNRAGEARVISI